MSDSILICDDEELIRWSLAEHLQLDGYTTLTATNGQECLDAVREHAPALVIMDLKMPVMDGLTALRLLRETDADLPVIIITAHGGVESAIEATRLGAPATSPSPSTFVKPASRFAARSTSTASSGRSTTSAPARVVATARSSAIRTRCAGCLTP